MPLDGLFLMKKIILKKEKNMKEKSTERLICMFSHKAISLSAYHCSLECPEKKNCDLSEDCCMEDQENCDQENCPHIICLSWKHCFLNEQEYRLLPLKYTKTFEYFLVSEGVCTSAEFSEWIEEYKREFSLEKVNWELF